MINPLIPERSSTFGKTLYRRCAVWTLLSLLPMLSMCILAAFQVYPDHFVSFAPFIVYSVVALLFQLKVTTSFPNRACAMAFSYLIFCTTMVLMMLGLAAYRGDHPELSRFITGITGIIPAPLYIGSVLFFAPMPVILLSPAVFVAVLRNFIGPRATGRVTELGCGQHKQLQDTALAPPAIPLTQSSNE